MSVDRKSDVIVEVEMPNNNNDVTVILTKNSKADKHTTSFYEGGEQTSPNSTNKSNR